MIDTFKEYEKNIIPFVQKANVKLHPKCVEDINEVVQEGEIPTFLSAYKTRIDYLSSNLGKETFHRKWFEILKKSDGLRSIRFLNFKNLRILYMIDNNIAFLLLAFEERQGHQKTDYSGFIETAINRFNEEKEK